MLPLSRADDAALDHDPASDPQLHATVSRAIQGAGLRRHTALAHIPARQGPLHLVWLPNCTPMRSCRRRRGSSSPRCTTGHQLSVPEASERLGLLTSPLFVERVVAVLVVTAVVACLSLVFSPSSFSDVLVAVSLC